MSFLTTDRKFTYGHPWNVLSGVVTDKLYEKQRNYFIVSLIWDINTDKRNTNIHILRCQETILKVVPKKTV